MFFMSDIFTVAPNNFKTTLQQNTYKVLDFLNIPFERVDTDEAITMNDCTLINKKLNMKDVVDEEFYGCSDGTTTCYLKTRTTDIIHKFLPYTKHKAHIIQI